MGNKIRKYHRIETDEDIELQTMENGFVQTEHTTTLFPWFGMIQWACEDLPSGTVFRWNLSSIQNEMKKWCSSKYTFLQSLSSKHIPHFSLDSHSLFAEWGVALLACVPNLSNVRYELVPSTLKEDRFWERFFSTAKEMIQRNVLQENQKS